MSESTFTKVFDLIKVDEMKHEVYGIATEQKVDSSGEMLLYEESKPYFQAWSENAEKITGGKSKGNLRRMHQLEAIGKLVDIQFDDAAKRITIGAKVTNDQAWKDVLEGVLPAFSIGGRYVSRKKEGEITKYVCAPSEISLVDLPCLPSAVVEMIKADGTTEKRTWASLRKNHMDEITDFGHKLDNVWRAVQALNKGEAKTKRVAGEDLGPSAFAYVGDKEDTSTWKLPLHFSSEEKSKRHVRNALARFNQTKGIPEGEKAKVHAKIVAAAKKYGIDVQETSDKANAIHELMKGCVYRAMKSVDGGDKVIKSLSNISDLAYVLQTLSWVRMDSLWEATYEGEDGDERDAAIAVEIEAAMVHLIEILKDTVDEETDELLTGKAAPASESAASAAIKEVPMTQEEVKKAADSLHSHFTKAAAHHSKMAGVHKAKSEMHAEKAAHHAAKAADGLEEMKDVHKALHAFHKAASDHDGDEAEAHDKMAVHCAAMAENCSYKAATGEPMTQTQTTPAAAPAAAEPATAAEPAHKADAPAATDPAPATATIEIRPDEAAFKSLTEGLTKMLADLSKTVTDAVAGIDAKVEAAVNKALENKPAPPPQGFTLVPRQPAEATKVSLPPGSTGL